MNQTEATEVVAAALNEGAFWDISILRPLLIDGTQGSSLILASADDVRLSVTVEILAQP